LFKRNIVAGIVESLALILCLTFGGIWYLNPQGNWEPLFATCTLFFIAAELFRRYGYMPKCVLSDRFSPGQLIQLIKDEKIEESGKNGTGSICR
jgi:hypothetical protein